jgi:hypothetical protein
MRKLLLSLTAASALVAAGAAPASAMSVGMAAGLKAAIADTSMVDDVAYVCRHRYWSSRRVCWWRPGGYRWHRRWRWRR